MDLTPSGKRPEGRKFLHSSYDYFYGKDTGTAIKYRAIMTADEAKLARIWEPEWVYDNARSIDHVCLFYARLAPHLHMEVLSSGSINLYFHDQDDENDDLKTMVASDKGNIYADESLGESLDYWMPRFRRSCWLSGYPIDCSEQEKLEWELWLNAQEAVEYAGANY